MKKRFLIDEHTEEIAQMEKDLHEHISFDEWSAREYGVESIDYYSTAINLLEAGYRKVQDKIYQNVEQECSCCGKRFFLKYCSDGTYEYDGHVCDCIATFHPVAGEPTISTWLDQINGRIAVTMKG